MAVGLRLAALISNQMLRCATSPDGVDGGGDKAGILRRPGPLLFLFQATALRVRPFCMESPKAAARKREERPEEAEEGEARRTSGKSGRTKVQPPPMPPPPYNHLTSSYCSFLDGCSGLFHLQLAALRHHAPACYHEYPRRPKTKKIYQICAALNRTLSLSFFYFIF